MSIPFAGLLENPLNFRRFKKIPKNQNLKKLRQTYPNLKSLWAFLSFTFIYISAFYIFKLSPSTIICTTKFWFFISNTLVLIIAADFSAFAAAKRRDFHEEHAIKDTTSLTSSKSSEFPSSEVVSLEMTTTTSFDVEEEEEEEEPQEKIVNTVVNNCREKKPEKCVRSNSENAIVLSTVAAAEEEGKVVALQRTLSEGHDHREEVNNEFSRMSDEELNRRVEEFIQRFHRQIRLQSVGNRHDLQISTVN